MTSHYQPEEKPVHTPMYNYWSDIKTDPRRLPIAQREAWHLSARDYEQNELSELTGYPETYLQYLAEIWEG
jgi:hypothetical protein